MGPDIHPGERGDFEEALREQGVSPEDFELSIQNQVIGTYNQTTHAPVTVRHIKSGQMREYVYMTWVDDFIRDLKAGLFDGRR